MSILHRLIAAALSAASLSAFAQGASQDTVHGMPADPADPKAAVPAAAYDPVLGRYRRPDDESSPEKVWRQANIDVQGGGHAGHGHAAAAPVNTVKPAPAQGTRANHETHHSHHH